jgi:Lipopolysaccharide-assembly
MRRWSLLLCFLLTACGYRVGDDAVVSRYRTVSVPYVECDDDGRLTDALVHAISASGALQYRQSGGDLCLKAKVTAIGHDNIGYEYDTSDSGKRTDRLIPNEGRLIYQIEVTLVDRCRGCTVLGPFCVRQSLDFPFDPLATDTQIAVQSLGQFTNIDDAEWAAKRPLYDALARKIVDYLVAAW